MQHLHVRLLSASAVPEADLSMPARVTTLPFICLDEHIPERMRVERIGQGARQFHFMGRPKMAHLLSTIRSLSNMTLRERAEEKTAADAAAAAASTAPMGAGTTSSSSPSSLFSSSSSCLTSVESVFAKLLVYGTPGWGKSYMMAAAAVMLRQEFFARPQSSVKRVVYLPDCGQLREEPVAYMKNALLLAFAESSAFLQQIYQCSSTEQLVTFCRNVPKDNCFLLFLADQTNKLTAKHSDPVEKQQLKMNANGLLRRCANQHFLVEAISINDSNKEEVQQKQENRKEMPMFGELEEVRCHNTQGGALRNPCVRATLITPHVWCFRCV